MVEHRSKIGKNFMPAVKAAKFVDYTPDYVTRLAREGKIEAQREGRQWLVELDSLKLFTLEVAAEKRRRQEALREERKKEKILHAMSVLTPEREQILNPTPSRLAFLEAAVVTVCFLFLGSLGYSLVQSDVQSTDVTRGVSTVQKKLQTAFSFAAVDAWWNTFGKEKNITRTADPASMIVVQNIPAVPQVDSATGEIVFSAELLAQSFSDEVTISFEEKERGVVVPHFRNHTGEAHTFVISREVASTSTTTKNI